MNSKDNSYSITVRCITPPYACHGHQYIIKYHLEGKFEVTMLVKPRHFFFIEVTVASQESVHYRVCLWLVIIYLKLRFSPSGISDLGRVFVCDYSWLGLWFNCSQKVLIDMTSNLSTLSVLDEGYSRNASCTLNWISTCLFVTVVVLW